jgi:hypothetical protein
MSKPSKVAKYLAEAERLTALIDAYRAKAGLERSPAPTKLKQLPALDRPTEIPGFPLGRTGQGRRSRPTGPAVWASILAAGLSRERAERPFSTPLGRRSFVSAKVSESRRAISEPGVAVQ